MRSALPKVLQALAGKPLLAHVLETAQQLAPRQTIVVYGHGGTQVPRALVAFDSVVWVEQTEQLGTGHAVQQCVAHLPDDGYTLVLYGDVPLLRVDTLTRLLVEATQGMGLLTARLANPQGYGRIVRDERGNVQRIVEEKDATAHEKKITEINTGVMVLPNALLATWMARLTNHNAQGEYYLTDVIALAVADKVNVATLTVEDETEILGINDKQQLAYVERCYQQAQAQRLLQAGVTLLDPARLDIRGSLHCGQDVSIDVNCVFNGEVYLEDEVSVGAHCVLSNCTIGAGTVIAPFSHIEGAVVGADAVIGPYARLRPQTQLADGVHIGNFVEVKNSQFGSNSKANHLAYVGDATLGARVNVGAGTITCNYDGAYKHRTVIGDDVFIGSDTQLVAPVTIAEGATIGAGSTITRNVDAQALALSRSKQTSIENWVRPRKSK